MCTMHVTKRLETQEHNVLPTRCGEPVILTATQDNFVEARLQSTAAAVLVRQCAGLQQQNSMCISSGLAIMHSCLLLDSSYDDIL
jgi:hypothetical protein